MALDANKKNATPDIKGKSMALGANKKSAAPGAQGKNATLGGKRKRSDSRREQGKMWL